VSVSYVLLCGRRGEERANGWLVGEDERGPGGWPLNCLWYGRERRVGRAVSPGAEPAPPTGRWAGEEERVGEAGGDAAMGALDREEVPRGGAAVERPAIVSEAASLTLALAFPPLSPPPPPLGTWVLPSHAGAGRSATSLEAPALPCPSRIYP
jgi:hypothetical protein